MGFILTFFDFLLWKTQKVWSLQFLYSSLFLTVLFPSLSFLTFARDPENSSFHLVRSQEHSLASMALSDSLRHPAVLTVSTASPAYNKSATSSDLPPRDCKEDVS